MQRAVLGSVVTFAPEGSSCPECGGALGVLKTRTRRVATLAQGELEAREVIKICRSQAHADPVVVRSAELFELVPLKQRFGWDVVVHVGVRRFLDLCQRCEILQELREVYGITTSAGTVSALCDRFVRRLEALHVSKANDLREAMEGGYALHLDSTNETGKGGMCVALDGVRGWVLSAGRIATERSEALEPVVERTVALFGKPVAVMRDMSKACAAAVAGLREQGVPDFVCHYHFIADIGSDLMQRNHERLMSALKAAKVTASLREVLANLGGTDAIICGAETAELAAAVYCTLTGHGRTPRFPFGLPHLEYAQRVLSAPRRVAETATHPRSKKTQQVIKRLEDIVAALQERDAGDLIKRLERPRLLFEKLREILRMEDRSIAQEQPLLPEAEVLLRNRIQDELKSFEDDLRVQARPREMYDHSTEWVVLDHLARYKDKLFGQPVVRDSNQRILFVVARTNNILECFFSGHKQRIRRRTGRRHVGRELELLPPQALLAENLRHPTYVRVLCGSLTNLPRAFANLEPLPRLPVSLRPANPRRLAAYALGLLAEAGP